MTKTETWLLDQLRTHPRFVVSMHYGRGPCGGEVRGGQRQIDAARKLRDAGKVRIVKSEKYSVSGGGYTQFGFDLVLELA